uniref:Uncharacterized protein n=1 Tax=Chromera velia CCMP2878 TaxID=1169474 RepID=A0A0G4HRC3_9ALVE|eukprot:Cvel_30563.t1-p1 / transcript=Cvel_30563.t1 / gene=Cvel_30563 / organism=Chromera_velia_CCMP2878 / gene_product=hypothetical protein / transcript_product=hypothetical protein / location=Cvel_scaffold4377:738-4872(-) / protein_length=321 / sequence_SO=supercontig / SO=protein_coding / is_pseudo=false
MWLYMCYSEEAHIRVATLSNHLLQNNDFTKLMRLCLAACEEAHFPDLTCVQPSDVSTIEYGGNTYTDLYTFKEPSLPSYQNETTTMAWDMFQTCREYAANITNHYDYQNTGRQAKLHTCFPSCKRNVETENPDVYDYGSGDTRPVCTTEDQSRRLVNSDFSDLICVDPDDAVDPWAGPFEICAGSGFCFSWAYVLLIIAVANTFQVVIEFLMLYVMTLVDDAKEDCLEATVKTILQFILMFTFCLVVVFAVGPFILQSRVGRPYIIPATWFLALVTDQLKNFAVQCLIWWLVIRRCGRVDPGIQEYNEEYLMQWELQDSLA